MDGQSESVLLPSEFRGALKMFKWSDEKAAEEFSATLEDIQNWKSGDLPVSNTVKCILTMQAMLFCSKVLAKKDSKKAPTE